MLNKMVLMDPRFMSSQCTAVISVMVLQNSMDLLKGEFGSSSKTCVTSTVDGNNVTGIEAERVTYIQEEEGQEPMKIPVIKMEPKVRGVPVVSVCTIHIGCVQNCRLLCQSVLMIQKFDSREWISNSLKRINLYFVTYCV
jgi:hypothetical protein